MGEEKSVKIEQDLRQIVDMILLNGTLTECPGLVHGKTGIAVFFFHYARHTGDELFADYAMDLISEMLNQIHVNSPADYEKGLAGIGAGIYYMIRNDFLNVEDDIYEDFDQRMVRAVMFDPCPDFNQYCGLTGYGRYWMTRLHYQMPSTQARNCLLRIIAMIEENLTNISIQEYADVYCFLKDLHQISDFDAGSMHALSLLGRISNPPIQDNGITNAAEHVFLRLGDSMVGNIVRMVQQCRYFNSKRQDEINAALMQIQDLDMEKAPVNMGLLNGYAGEGMLRLTVLNQADMLWTNLL